MPDNGMTQVNLRISKQLKHYLQRQAAREMRSLNSYIVWRLCNDAIERAGPDNPAILFIKDGGWEREL